MFLLLIVSSAVLQICPLQCYKKEYVIRKKEHSWCGSVVERRPMKQEAKNQFLVRAHPRVVGSVWDVQVEADQ